MGRRCRLGRALTALAALLCVAGLVIGRPAAQASPLPEKSDFMFQVDGYHTANQGGHTLNLYFKYRYPPALADADIPDYRALRSVALDYLDRVDPAKGTLWEILNREICTQLAAGFPVEAISCQIQVFPRRGLEPDGDPGVRSATYTIGDIEPLAVAGPIFVP